ncbi:hypothetical protein DL93DRAFT_2165848 [Clavulina sp. PMI_390]|nr:hypothetical protein DL93DRAFT_2165848 [Clavulina sp. PMI_390]
MDPEWLESTQLSNDSEDGPLAYFELIKKIQADKAKKKRQQESQFLSNARKNLTHSVTNTALKLNGVVVDLENAFEPMLAEYGEIEDRICEVWKELLDEHEHFISLCDANQAAFTLAQEQREERHDAALRSIKSACKEMKRAAEHIDPKLINAANS